MITIMYPTGLRAKNSGDSYIEYQYMPKCTWYRYLGGSLVASDVSANRFLVNNTGSHLAGDVGAIYSSKQINLDTLVQRSRRFDYLNFFDTTRPLPRLSSGKVEQSCYHESISGFIALHPDDSPGGAKLDPNALYPGYYDIDSTGTVGWDGKRMTCSKIRGFCLARNTGYLGSTSGDALTPQYWINSEFTHYTWYDKRVKTLDEALKKGIVTIDTYIKTDSAIITPYYPVLYLRSCSVSGTKIYQHGERLFGAACGKISNSLSYASNFSIPNVDLLIEQLSRDRNSLVAPVLSKLKYPEEVWYNLILAGAREIKRLDMNNIANILEIPGMIRVFDKIYNQFISFKNGQKVYTNPTTGKLIKKAACIYLGIHYGVKLTVMDLKEIVQTFKDNPSLLRQLRRKVVSYSKATLDGNSYHCKSCMTPKSGREVTDVRDLTRILGIELSALNLWDLVPWSFVVDWFIPISDILDSFENIARLESTYDLDYLVETVSRSETVSWKDYRLRVKIYDRYVTDHMPEFGFTVGDASGLNNHVIEASALIINGA